VEARGSADTDGQLQSSGENVDIQPHSDRQGQIVFYTIQFRE
jgi:hypothetical protein